ncbi:beta-N-acetylhexosaminidase [Actinoplanes philippinensis]|uniref:beta-N-acetylhexosaminidase n=1 Tax=Actinoplanes philippinensis TaxID=35752 RepID=A0A1I2JAB1_9ACTN|nr:beta-N-acetylhexosaminidase [Actinoplanes philippinensis]GIE79856.1 beta-N-acetylhexosaminidase [Actinoplanes philippinensis]SFF51735.1 hexosaminidase [Actinoplanes philippinensis]
MRLSRLAAALVAALPLVTATASAASSPAPSPIALTSVLPAVAEAQPDPGNDFRITAGTVIVGSGEVAGQLAAALRPATGFALPIGAMPAANAITLRLEPGHGDEGYRLTIRRDGVELLATGRAGLFNGVQTLRQLLPPAIEADTPQRRKWIIPGGTIDDRPRYAYRGTMLDLARHFHTPDEIRTHIDRISRFKINHLHLHLSDDQGWRIRIDAWPRLTEIGGAPGTGVGGDGGGFLTKDDYRGLVRYAADRNITIVPEIDMPGHVNAAQIAYPELTCDGVAPRQRTDMRVGYSTLCVRDEITYRFVEDVIRELAEMTPGPYLHIGGDETFATPHGSYLAFQRRVLPLVEKYGKIPYGWHEIGQSPASATSVLQFWGRERNHPAVATAVAAGAKVIMSPADHTYLDMEYDLLTPGGLDWAGAIEVSTAYGWDPATLLPGIPATSILGVEAPLWSETLRTEDDIEFLAFPRLVAIAELGWSPRVTHDWASFRTRLGAYGPRWVRDGVRFHRSPEIRWS